MTLMGIFSDHFTIFHQFNRSVAKRDLSGRFDWQSGLHFGLHEATLSKFEISVVVEFFVEDGSSLCVYLYSL